MRHDAQDLELCPGHWLRGHSWSRWHSFRSPAPTRRTADDEDECSTAAEDDQQGADTPTPATPDANTYDELVMAVPVARKRKKRLPRDLALAVIPVSDDEDDDAAPFASKSKCRRNGRDRRHTRLGPRVRRQTVAKTKV